MSLRKKNCVQTLFLTSYIKESETPLSSSRRVRRVSCSLILKMKSVPPSLPRSSYVPSSFWSILYCLFWYSILCPSSVRVVATFSGTVLFLLSPKYTHCNSKLSCLISNTKTYPVPATIHAVDSVFSPVLPSRNSLKILYFSQREADKSENKIFRPYC
jgi:hypothetical protein